MLPDLLRNILTTDKVKPSQVKFISGKQVRLASRKSEYTLFPLVNLNDAITQAKINKDIFRFLVRMDGTMWLGFEGSGITVPVHYQLTGEAALSSMCICAGNISVNDAGEICQITNRSGDFEPPAETLIYALKIIASVSGVHFADTVTFNLLRGTRLSAEFTVSKQDLESALAENNYEVLAQPSENITVTYQPKFNPRRHAASGQGVARSLFKDFNRSEPKEGDDVLGSRQLKRQRLDGAGTKRPSNPSASKTLFFGSELSTPPQPTGDSNVGLPIPPNV